MLVLSRRQSEAIRFPQLDILVRVLGVKAGHCRIGIEAPEDVMILREELFSETQMATLQKVLDRLPADLRHDLRNEINAIHIGLTVIEKQLARDNVDAAFESLQLLQQQVKELTQHSVLCRPEKTPPSVEKTADAATGSKVTESAPSQHTAEDVVVLLVEDNDNERELLARLLRLSGIEVVTASNGEEALLWLQEHDAPTYVLSDMKMPGGDGASLIRRMRSDGFLERTRVFGLSGHAQSESGLASTEVDGWFPKPINVESLLSCVTSQSQHKPHLMTARSC